MNEDRLKQRARPIVPGSEFESLNVAAFEPDIDVGHHQEGQHDRKPNASLFANIIAISVCVFSSSILATNEHE